MISVSLHQIKDLKRPLTIAKVHLQENPMQALINLKKAKVSINQIII